MRFPCPLRGGVGRGGFTVRARLWLPPPQPSPARAGLSHMTFQNPICATLESQRASEGNFRIQLGPFGWEKNRKIPYAIPLPARGRVGERGPHGQSRCRHPPPCPSPTRGEGTDAAA